MIKKLLIIEPELSGHHRSYLEWIVAGAIENGFSVIIGTTSQAQTILVSDPLFEGVEFITADLPVNAALFGGIVADLKREFAFWNWARKINGISNSHTQVLLPYMDYMLNAIAVFGSPFKEIPFSGICMRPTFHHKKMGINTPTGKVSQLKEVLFNRLLKLRSLQSIFTIDESLAEFFKNSEQSGASKVIYMPDPSDAKPSNDKSGARLALHLPLDKKIILIYGAVTKRKGVFELLNYVMQSQRDDVHVLLAGKQDESVEKFIESNINALESKITQINRRVLNEEEPDLFNACDIVWICYDQHYTMSGQMIKAAQYSKFIVTKNEGLAGWLCLRCDLGYALSEVNMDSIDKAINIIFSKENSNILNWIGMHSKKNAISIVYRI